MTGTIQFTSTRPNRDREGKTNTMTEAELVDQNLRLVVQHGLLECVTANLAGLHVTENAQKFKIVAYFFEEPTELDREYIEETCGLVMAQYSWDYDYSVEYKLISETDTNSVAWFFLRAEADRNAVGSARRINAEECAVINGYVLPEAALAGRKLSLCVEGALRGRVTANLAGLYATSEAKKVNITACFFEQPTVLDRKYIESAAADVIAQYAEEYTVSTEYKLISEVARGVMPWEFLRVEAYTYDDDPA